MSWSVPCDAMENTAPPTMAATALNGLVRMGAVTLNTWNLPAA